MNKKYLINTQNLILKLLYLNTLSKKEINGELFFLTKIKLKKRANINVPFTLGRTNRGLSFNICEKNDPLGIVMNKISQNNKSSEHLISELYEYLKIEEKKNIFNYFYDLTDKSLGNLPIWSLSYPWEIYNTDYKIKNFPNLVFKNRKNYLSNTESKKFDNFFYNVLLAKSHINQFNDIFLSFKNNGFIKTFDLPKIHILIKDKKWRWVMSGNGNHRAYVMYFLKYKFLPAEIVSIVKRDQIKFFIHKFKHNYSESFGLSIFDKIFHGESITRGII